MNLSVFILVLVIGFIAFIATNKLWEAAGGEVTKPMVVIAAAVIVIIAGIVAGLA